MTKRIDWIWGVVLATLVLRLISMAVVGFVDTSEPRYAEIARLMVTSNDWITPWFEPGKPFWAKPVLAFWAQAASMKVLGINEFAARFPSFLATVATLALMWRLGREIYGELVATHAAAIFATTALAIMGGCAVLTDPFLVLGTTLTLSGLLAHSRGLRGGWTLAIFAGLTVALLAKGPIGAIFGLGPAIGLAVLRPSGRRALRQVPWVRGLIAVALTTAPWYLAAEQKTPGFLHYFIVGEHYLRFVDPGWGGDMYGIAHKQFKGMIWVYGIGSTFPWGLIFVGLLVAMWRRTSKPLVSFWRAPDEVLYLSMWAIMCPAFFTMAGNVIWTYWLPSLPAISLLIARAMTQEGMRTQRALRAAYAVMPVVIIAYTLVGWDPVRIKTEKPLGQYALAHMQEGDTVAWMAGNEFSARFYTGGRAVGLEPYELPAFLSAHPTTCYLAVQHKLKGWLDTAAGETLPTVASDMRYEMVVLPPGTAARKALEAMPVSAPERKAARPSQSEE